MSVNSTPRNPRSHAAKLIGKVRGCTSSIAGEEEENG
jgi:hypothetical protein